MLTDSTEEQLARVRRGRARIQALDLLLKRYFDELIEQAQSMESPDAQLEKIIAFGHTTGRLPP